MRGAFFCVLIDPNDDIAGFIVDWIKALAGRLESLDVIALENRARPVDLPANVRLLSLGKERGLSRPRLFLNSQRALARALKRADFLLCHMMPVYALVAAPLCRFKSKPLLLWYTHQHLDLKLRAAARAADLILTAAPEAMGVATPKKRVLGHGIDAVRFAPGPLEPRPGALRVLSVGRFSPVKRLEVLLEAARCLDERGRLDDFRFILVGKEGNQAQAAYAARIRAEVGRMGLNRAFEFRGGVSHAEVDALFREADVFVSTQEQRGLDKAVLEAMACGLPVMLANQSFEALLADESRLLLYPPRQPARLAEGLMRLREFSLEERRRIGLELRRGVVENHELGRLMDRVVLEAAALLRR